MVTKRLQTFELHICVGKIVEEAVSIRAYVVERSNNWIAKYGGPEVSDEESFNIRIRDELLDDTLFMSLDHAQARPSRTTIA